MNIIKTRLKEFFLLWRNYSFIYAWYGIVWWFCFYTRPPFCNKLSTYAINKKTKWLDRYFKRNYSHIIDKYKTVALSNEKISEPKIWVFWGQGEENMPPLVKACYKQLRHHNDNVQLLTNDNVNNFIKLPDIVMRKVNSGEITWAYFSDIIRNSVLAKHGGLWVDATAWTSGEIPIEIFLKYKFISPSEQSATNNRSVRFWSTFNWNWNGWCMWSNCKNYKIFSFVADMLIEIAKRENVIPDYVTIDYLIYLAIRLFPETHQDLEKAKEIPCSNRHKLALMMNEVYDENKYKELIKDNFIFKLSFRANWYKTTKEGKQTFYGRILENII